MSRDIHVPGIDSLGVEYVDPKVFALLKWVMETVLLNTQCLRTFKKLYVEISPREFRRSYANPTRWYEGVSDTMTLLALRPYRPNFMTVAVSLSPTLFDRGQFD